SKQAESEKSTRPKSKLLELKPFEFSTTTLNEYLYFSKICAATDHSMSLVEIVELLGVLPLIIGQHSTASRNYSVTRQRLLFSADLICSFRAQYTGTKGEDKTLCVHVPSNSKYLNLRDSSTPQLKLLLVLKKTQVQPFKKGISNSARQDSIMNAHNKTQLLMQRSNVPSKIQVVTHQYQINSCSQYLLQMQVQAQPKCSNAPSQGMIPYSHTMVYNLKFRNQMQHSHSQRRTQCIISPISLPVFSNQYLLQLTQDQKGLFKACNGVECK
ncbi:hypothetical protein H5410_014781, partial [Solanum commersonii]